jgi:hypothetical protein
MLDVDQILQGSQQAGGLDTTVIREKQAVCFRFNLAHRTPSKQTPKVEKKGCQKGCRAWDALGDMFCRLRQIDHQFEHPSAISALKLVDKRRAEQKSGRMDSISLFTSAAVSYPLQHKQIGRRVLILDCAAPMKEFHALRKCANLQRHLLNAEVGSHLYIYLSPLITSLLYICTCIKCLLHTSYLAAKAQM